MMVVVKIRLMVEKRLPWEPIAAMMDRSHHDAKGTPQHICQYMSVAQQRPYKENHLHVYTTLTLREHFRSDGTDSPVIMGKIFPNNTSNGWAYIHAKATGAVN